MCYPTFKMGNVKCHTLYFLNPRQFFPSSNASASETKSDGRVLLDDNTSRSDSAVL